MSLTVSFARAIVFSGLAVLGAFAVWTLAPVIDGWMFPIFADQHLVPWDATRPSVLAERQLDRVCWRVYVHKLRDAVAYRRTITFVLPDGTRQFAGGPLDGRTGEGFSNKDAAPRGFNGQYGTCAYIPNGFDATQAFTIESWGQYQVPHHPWLIEHLWPIIPVPGMEDSP